MSQAKNKFNLGNLSFLEKITIKKRLLLLIVMLSGVLFISMAVVSSIQSYNNLMGEKETQLKEATGMALSTVQMYYEKAKKGEMSEEQAKKLAKEAVSNLLYDNKKGYVWIQDYNGIMIMHPFNKGLIGQDLNSTPGKKGKLFFAEISKEIEQKGEIFVTYFWTKPNMDENQVFPKLSYGVAFNEWNWALCSGIYIDDVQHKLFDSVAKSIIYSFIALLAVIFLVNVTIVRSIINPIYYLTDVCLKLAENDLTVDIKEDNNKTEIGDLTRSISTLVNNMRHLIAQIKEKSLQVNSSSQELQSISETSSEVANQVAETIEQMATGSSSQAEEVNKSARDVAEIASVTSDILQEVQNVSNAATESAVNVRNGQADVDETITKITEIKDTTEKLAGQIEKLGNLGQEIGKIVQLITDIASQTNLLALNAAIESARAGEHGKGFAVVAEEVKKLAEESAEAAEQIKGMIEQIQDESHKAVESTQVGVSRVEEGVVAVNKVKEIFNNINNYSNDTQEKTAHIYDSIEGLNSKNDQVSTAMESISSVTEEAAAAAEEVAASMEEQNAGMQELSASAQVLASLTVELNEHVSKFKV